ncbi:cerebellin-3-like [Ruditapes philippinarum]|uniref:cerebellin-3-like n=1 Tax=Ruditapes philippinarum TaxID=129788 RepID=UPI00295BA0E4|nr:cerebellin-3-like [Ruditapes philippinarum]
MMKSIVPYLICVLLLVTLETAESQECVINATPKVAFNAYYSTGSGNYGVNQSIVFPLVLLNEGGGYNESTGIFTAPVSGMYQFSINICNADGKYMTAAIVHENTRITSTTTHSATTSICTSATIPARLTTGERVYVQSTFNNLVMLANEHRYPSFTGVLINV